NKKRGVNMQDNPSIIETLPQEMLIHIFSFFNKRELAKAGKVCRSFHHLSHDEQLQKHAAYPPLDYTHLLPEKSYQLKLHAGIVTCIAELSDNEIVSASADKTLRIWNIKTRECTKILAGHSDWVRCVAQLS